MRVFLPCVDGVSVAVPGGGERFERRAQEIQMSTAFMACPDEGLSAFLNVRPRLFRIAYRMLGSAAEAEEIVQDVWLRWQAADRSIVRDAAAFLATTTTRLAINVMQSARARRETYVGPWLPEPADTGAGPQVQAERGQAFIAGVRLLLAQLSRTERAAFILREAFDYPYRDIATVLRLEEANARQVVTRARKRLRDCGTAGHAPSSRGRCHAASLQPVTGS
jgi:RNA polymerase sigma-70 factor, ECF subfamily